MIQTVFCSSLLMMIRISVLIVAEPPCATAADTIHPSSVRVSRRCWTPLSESTTWSITSKVIVNGAPVSRIAFLVGGEFAIGDMLGKGTNPFEWRLDSLGALIVGLLP